MADKSLVSSVPNPAQELIAALVAFVRRYVSLTEGQALVVVLWALNTWVYDRFPVVPYLEIWASFKRSGKSTLAEVLAKLTRGGRVTATVRVLQMVRIITGKKGDYTPFIEEAERFSAGNLGDERAILATGYRKGAAHEIYSAQGIKAFRTFCPKAFVLIGNVHDILRDRCISIKMERATPERVWSSPEERYTAEAEADDLLSAWTRVAAHHLDVIRGTDGEARFHTVIPTWLKSPRDREIWTPLFSLASAMKLDAATMDLLQRASIDLSILKTLPPVKYSAAQDEHIAESDASAAETVLRDLLSTFAENEQIIPTRTALERLHNIPTAPWRAWRGDGLTDVSLAALLKRFGVEHARGQHGKGKTRTQFYGYTRGSLLAAAKEHRITL